jgi:hypothetical protein
LDEILKPEARERLTIDEVIGNGRVRPSVERVLNTPEFKAEYIMSEKHARFGKNVSVAV